MNKNGNNNPNNAAGHSAKLELFFQSKMTQDKINRKILKNLKVSKKQRQNKLSFDFDVKQFRLVDQNNVASVSVSRIAKKNESKLLNQNIVKLQKNKQQILKTKYELLFEYKNIEEFGAITSDIIEPLEESNKKSEKTIETIESRIQRELDDYISSRADIFLELDVLKEGLRNNVTPDKSVRIDFMTNYLEKRQELYELDRQYYFNHSQIVEMTTKHK